MSPPLPFSVGLEDAVSDRKKQKHPYYSFTWVYFHTMMQPWAFLTAESPFTERQSVMWSHHSQEAKPAQFHESSRGFPGASQQRRRWFGDRLGNQSEWFFIFLCRISEHILKMLSGHFSTSQWVCCFYSFHFPCSHLCFPPPKHNNTWVQMQLWILIWDSWFHVIVDWLIDQSADQLAGWWSHNKDKSWFVSTGRGRENKKDDRDRKTRGFPPLMNGVYSIKTDAGYNFIVTTPQREK